LPRVQCQADAYFVDAPVGAEQALPAAGAHRYTTRGSVGWAAGPKSAVRPRAAHHVLVNLVAPETGFEPYRALKVQEVLIKQARGPPSHSPPAGCAKGHAAQSLGGEGHATCGAEVVNTSLNRMQGAGCFGRNGYVQTPWSFNKACTVQHALLPA